MDKINKALKQYFGYDNLKPFQEKVFNHINGDLLILSPTGSGKSLCYQLPALVDDGITVIISPLKSLIEDQVGQLKQRNIKVDFINSDFNKKDLADLYKKLKNVDGYHMLYVTPEIITTDSKLITLLKELHKNNKFARLVIDEAHCVSTWGHDFRHSYLNLVTIKKMFDGIRVMALTATATPKVKEDIIKILELDNPHIETSSFFRPNLFLKVINRNDTNLSYLRDLINKNYSNQNGVIYCHSQMETERVATYLDNYIPTKHYHAGLNSNIRKLYQKQWINGTVKIIVATIAFGMGIDKPDVRFVIHYNLPSSMEGYYQEIGRAGRDGNKSDCILYYSCQDKIFYDKMIRQNKNSNSLNEHSSNYQVNLSNIEQVDFINHNSDDDENDKNKNNNNKDTTKDSKKIKDDHLSYQLNKLNGMVNFVENIIDCRHFQLSNYFGEKTIEKLDWCNGSCDNCLRHKGQNNIQEKDMTEHTIKLLEIIQNFYNYNQTIKDKDKENDNENGNNCNTESSYISRKKINDTYQKNVTSLPVSYLIIERLINRLLSLNLIQENFILSEKSGLWFENIILTHDGINFLNDITRFNIILFVPNTKNSLSDMLVFENNENTENNSVFVEDNNTLKKKVTNKNKNIIFNFEEDCGKKSFNQELLDESLQEKYNLTNLPLFNQLIQYRSDESKRRKIAPYRVMTNQTIEEIVKLKPKTEIELKNISGIGEAKFREYGKDIIKLVSNSL